MVGLDKCAGTGSVPTWTGARARVRAQERAGDQRARREHGGRPPEGGGVALDGRLPDHLGAGPWSATNPVVADTANVLNSAMPIEPPICWEVLTIAEATPLSCAGTPEVAVANDGARSAEADADQHQRRQYVRGVGGVDADPREQHHAECGDEHARGHERSRAGAGQQPRARRAPRWARSRSSSAGTRDRSRAR